MSAWVRALPRPGRDPGERLVNLAVMREVEQDPGHVIEGQAVWNLTDPEGVWRGSVTEAELVRVGVLDRGGL